MVKIVVIRPGDPGDPGDSVFNYEISAPCNSSRWQFTHVDHGDVSLARGWTLGPLKRRTHKGDVAVVAMDGTRVVGMSRLHATVKRKRVNGKLEPIGTVVVMDGTWVHPSYRRLGLAKKLWARMIKELKPMHITVSAMTSRGMSLVTSMKEKHPEIEFAIFPGSCCRDLRKKPTAA